MEKLKELEVGNFHHYCSYKVEELLEDFEEESNTGSVIVFVIEVLVLFLLVIVILVDKNGVGGSGSGRKGENGFRIPGFGGEMGE